MLILTESAPCGVTFTDITCTEIHFITKLLGLLCMQYSMFVGQIFTEISVSTDLIMYTNVHALDNQLL